MKIIAAPGTTQPTIRLLAPGTTQATTTQLMTLVKTANGGFRLLPQSGAGNVAGANIVKTIMPISTNQQITQTTQGTSTPSKVIPTITKTMPGQQNIVTLSKSPMTTIQNSVSTTSISGQQTKTIILPNKPSPAVVQQPTIASSTAGTVVSNPAGLKYVVIQVPNQRAPTDNQQQQIIMNRAGVPQPITLQLPNSVVSTSGDTKTIPASALPKQFTAQGTSTVQTTSNKKIIQLAGTQLPPGIRFILPGQIPTNLATSVANSPQRIVRIPQSNASPTTLKQHQIVTLPASAVVSTGTETSQAANNADQQSKITQLDGPLDEEGGSKMEVEAKKDEPPTREEKMDVDGTEPRDAEESESSNKDEVKVKTEPSDPTDTKPQLLFASFNDMIGLEPPALLCADDPEPPSLPASAVAGLATGAAAISSTAAAPTGQIAVKEEPKESSSSAISNSQQPETNTDPLSTLASAAVSSQSQPINHSTSTDSVKLESSTTTNSNCNSRSTNSTENKPNTNSSIATASLSVTKSEPQSSPAPSSNSEPAANNAGHSENNAENKLNAANNGATNDNAQSSVNAKLLTKKNQWYDVDVFKSNTCTVSGYYLTQESHDQAVSDNLAVENEFKQPNYAQCLKVELEPGTTYKFRVASLNSCGRGPWSEVSAFQTGLPGHPGAPSAIKITTNPDASGALNAILSWDPPQFTSGTITGYLVQLSVKTAQGSNFVPVYCDKDPSCTVNSAQLQQAFIDMSTNKPAILFRISARNEKG